MTQIREINEAGRDLIQLFESFSPTVYICPTGYPTVGYGHVVRAGEVFDVPLTQEQGEELFSRDLVVYERSVCSLIGVPLSDNQYAALVSFTFNLGGGALQCSTLRSMINREEYVDAADEFPKWCWGGKPKRKLKGLLRRRYHEAFLFLT